MDDVRSGFLTMCQVGDPNGWFQPSVYGTCEERAATFGQGYTRTWQDIGVVCGGQPFNAITTICGP